MAKYINSEEFVINLDTMKNPDSEFATDDYIDGFSDGILAVIKELETMPTTDVEPVRHGHWIDNKHTDTAICSECKCVFTDETNYCPKCGAKMDNRECDNKWIITPVKYI